MVEFRSDWMANIDNMQKEMGRLLDHFGTSKPPMVNLAPTVWEPSVDMYETDRDIVVHVELAGLKHEDVCIIVDGLTVMIRGERQSASSQKRRTYYQMEIQRGLFERAISLPHAVDPDRVKANYEDGMVEIILPKTLKEKTRQVRIK